VKQAEAERKRQQQIELENAELLKLKQGDCLTFLKFWQRETIDLLLTDPPYGIDFQSNRRTASDKAEKIDNDTLDKALGLLDNMLKHAVPNMSENSIAVIWYDDRYQKQFEDIAKKNGLEVKTYLIWHKPNHGSGDLNIPAPNYEPALFCTKGNPVINKRIDRCIGTDKKEVYTDHPTEKPLSLLKTWVDAFTNESDLVVDPFMGTGSAILAAYELGRNVWGAEISEGYYEQAKERFLKLYRKKAAR
jgi:DNA modification methylase